MRYPICPRCGKGVLHIKDSVNVDGATYRKKVCNSCGHAVYTESREISHEEWREGLNAYGKRKRIERERRRESGR